MSRQQGYLTEGHDRNFYLASMHTYIAKKQELDKLLEQYIKPYLKQDGLNVLDAACGIGHIAYFLSALAPTAQFLGVDEAAYLIEEGSALCRGRSNVQLMVGDVNDLPERYRKHFDLTISWKTLSWLPYYEEMLRSFVAVTKHHIFLSSLFYDGDIDFEIRVREFQKEGGRDGFNQYYNVYSLPRFERFVLGLGAKRVEARDFEIGIDLPKPPRDHMRTYTMKLEDGHRVQISGAVVMSWKVVRIDL